MSMEETWKAFGEQEITHSTAHYLMTIDHLRKEHGYARVSDVARFMGITRGSTSLALKALREKGLVTEDHNRFLLLTEVGENIAHTIRGTRSVVMHFFTDILRMDKEAAEVDACKIEHLLSPGTSQSMLRFLQFATSDDPLAVAFRREFQRFDQDCAGATGGEGCGVCETQCLMHELVQCESE